MADTKISELNAGGDLQAADNLPVARGAANAKVTGTGVLNWVLSHTIKYDDAKGQLSTPDAIVADLSSFSEDVGQFAIGKGAAAYQGWCMAIGYQAVAGVVDDNNTGGGLAVGYQAEAEGKHATALGRSAIASGLNSVAIGDEPEASGYKATAIGNACTASGQYSTVMGDQADALADRSLSIGAFSGVSNAATDGIAIGYSASLGSSALNSIILGNNINLNVPNAFTIGQRVTLIGAYATADLPSAANYGGGLVYDTDASKLKYSNGGNWIELSASSGGLEAHNHSASEITSGQFADARISQGSVTQHQAALTLNVSQVTNAVESSTVANIVSLTQAAYDALTPDAGTLYIITDA